MTREEAIQVCNDVQSMFWFLSDKVKDAMAIAVEALKQPEQKKGYWSEKGVYIFECSICGEHVKEPLNYCPNCGAKMEEEE